jgi:hypothetical protein
VGVTSIALRRIISAFFGIAARTSRSNRSDSIE